MSKHMETNWPRGKKIVWGVIPQKPITGAPVGKTRLRLRNTRAAQLFVRTANGIRSFLLEDHGDTWFANPQLQQGANLRPLKCSAYLPGANITKAISLNPRLLKLCPT